MKINEIKQACIRLSGKKGDWIMEVVFEVIGKDTRTGISSRTGEPYVI